MPHHFKLDEIMQAYDVLAAAGENDALKVVLTNRPARQDFRETRLPPGWSRGRSVAALSIRLGLAGRMLNAAG